MKNVLIIFELSTKCIVYSNNIGDICRLIFIYNKVDQKIGVLGSTLGINQPGVGGLTARGAQFWEFIWMIHHLIGCQGCIVLW